jgi:acyl-CoA dehydrogenase
MDETRRMLEETFARVLADHAAPEAVHAAEAQGGFDPALWRTLEELGFTRIALPEDADGLGLSFADAAGLLRLAGRAGAPAPLLESALLAAPLVHGAGLPVPEGVLTVHAVPAEQTGLSARGTVLRGSLANVPAGRHAGHVALLLAGGGVALLARGSVRVTPGANLAGEARDDLRVEGVAVIPAPGRVTPDALRARAALGRAALMAGALERALELSLEYTKTRRQFGRPLAAFQAIQQQLAILAAEVAAVGALVDHAAQALDGGGPALAVAAAKVRAGQAAGVAARIAHQVHGAMGFTQEYPLHHATRRLWAWREEDGNEAHWARHLGTAVMAGGADGLWRTITAD